MKKKILTIALCLMLILPFGVFADSKKYETMNLEEVLTQEEIEHDLSNYKENDKQITIYLFRGYGCGYCHRFLEFLNSIVDEYGKYFKLVSYETWYNQDNYDLMTSVSNFLGQPATGVPYIVIGDKVFAGYANTFDDGIKSAITDLYNSTERYDVMDEMAKAEKKNNASTSMSNNDKWLIIGITGGLVILSSICIIWLTYKQNHILFKRICKLEEQNMEMKQALESLKINKEEKTKEEKVKAEKKSKTLKSNN